jgi:hypothetical protein
MVRRAFAGVTATLVVCSLIACSNDAVSGDDEHDNNNFRADVIECEDALARLQQCCPDFDAKPVLCNYDYDKSTGCGATTTSSVEPAFSLGESSCIRETSCDRMIEAKICERAQLARAYTSRKTTPTTPSSTSTSRSSATTTEKESHAPVCP